MDIQSAQYVQDEDGKNSCIKLVLASMPNDVPYLLVPLDPANRHYAEILKQVAEGTLTIAEAD